MSAWVAITITTELLTKFENFRLKFIDKSGIRSKFGLYSPIPGFNAYGYYMHVLNLLPYSSKLLPFFFVTNLVFQKLFKHFMCN